MTDREIVQKIYDNDGNCRKVEVYCKRCPIQEYRCSDSEVLERAKQWQKDNPKKQCKTCGQVCPYQGNSKDFLGSECPSWLQVSDNWQDLDLDNLHNNPADVLNSKKWDLEVYNEDTKKWEPSRMLGLIYAYKYRYRKHKLTLDEMAEKYAKENFVTTLEIKTAIIAYKAGHEEGKL